jgi:hypothetical protein
MKRPLIERTCLVGALGLGLLMAGCGSSSETDEDPPPAGFARLNCTVTSDQGGYVAGAKVSYQTTDAAGANKQYETLTGPDGKCAPLDMPLDEVSGVKLPAGTVVKDGYEPQTLICYGFSRTDVSCTAEVKLYALAANVSIPLGGDVVWHIGDSNFQGQPNSQLQKKVPDGGALEFEIADWATQVAKPGITKATVVIDHKGWQTSICPRNTLALQGDAGVVEMAGGNSPSNGGWGGGFQEDKLFVFQVSQVGLLSAKVRIAAGACRGDDLDDFEINRMRVYFCGAESRDCIPPARQ